MLNQFVQCFISCKLYCLTVTSENCYLCKGWVVCDPVVRTMVLSHTMEGSTDRRQVDKLRREVEQLRVEVMIARKAVSFTISKLLVSVSW